MDQLLPGGVRVGAQLVNHDLVSRLQQLIITSQISSQPYFFEALVHSVEGSIELPSYSLNLDVHLTEIVVGVGLGLRLVDSGQLVHQVAHHTPADRVTVVAEGAHGPGAGQSRVHTAKLHPSFNPV